MDPTKDDGIHYVITSSYLFEGKSPLNIIGIPPRIEKSEEISTSQAGFRELGSNGILEYTCMYVPIRDE